MRVLFVVEAGFKAGLGHLLRCRALLLELTSRAHVTELWLHGDESALAGRSWPKEMKLFRSADSESIDTTCGRIGQLLKDNRYDWLVIDGYSFSGHALHARLSAYGTRLLMLDDLADRELKTDILLNQSTNRREVYANACAQATHFLLGPEYALIDRAYAAGRDAPHEHGELRHVLITFGGVDRHDRTRRVIDLISQHADSLDIVAVVGPYYPSLDKLKSWRGRHSLRIVQNAHDLAESMRKCDLMVTAGGSTVWQACCVGAPMLALQTVDNQALVIKTLRDFDAALCLDASTNPDEEAGVPASAFGAAFRDAVQPGVRARLSSNAMQLVDGNGAKRVADTLESWN